MSKQAWARRAGLVLATPRPLASLLLPSHLSALSAAPLTQPPPLPPRFDAVIHFAGRKYVNESVDDPLRYYDHNVLGLINLADAMKKHGCKSMVFSSSCTVYGNPQYVPIDEAHPLKAVSPYGRTKLMIEDIFRDLAASDPEWRIILLRYFNPVGAHPSGALWRRGGALGGGGGGWWWRRRSWGRARQGNTRSTRRMHQLPRAPLSPTLTRNTPVPPPLFAPQAASASTR